MFCFAAVAVATASAAIFTDAADASCPVVNFYDQSEYLMQVNSIIAIVPSLLPDFLAPYDPFMLRDQTLDVQHFSAFGSSFNITPTVAFANISGASSLVPHPISVTSADSLQFGAEFKSTLQLQASVSLKIEQRDHQWFQPCYTSLLHPHECPPKTVAMGFQIGLQHPSAVLDATLDLVGCPEGVASCSDVSVGAIAAGLATGSPSTTIHTVLQRVTNIALQQVDFAFDAVSALSFSFSDAGSLIDSLDKWLLTFSQNEINKKGHAYNVVVDVAQSIVKKLLNNLIAEKLAPQFGSNCYKA